jgi:hypothetical protein
MGRASTSRRSRAAQETLRERMVDYALSSPKDTLAILAAVAATSIILVNALFLQKGRHPSPMFDAVPNLVSARQAAPANPMPRPRPATEAKAPEAPAARTDVPASASAPRPPVSVGAQRSDPLADLIVANRRIASAQRALTEFGFGQIKPTGVAGPETKIAVERFERERRLPVTGQLSDRVMREISAVTGRSFD